jgi:putative DNA primase/helicase
MRKLDLKCRVLAFLDKDRLDDATELLAMTIKKYCHIFTIRNDVKNEMRIYQDGIYKENGESHIKEFCRAILGECYRESIAKHVVDKIAEDTKVDAENFFGVNYINEIPVQNGILNIFTLELKPFTPKKVFFSKLPIKFDLEATCPKIEQFLKEILSKEDDIKVFYELAGFSFLKDYKFEKAFMLVGDGRNGKGKSIELLKRLVGMENCSALTLTMLNPESSDISHLFGKFLNVAGDIGNQDLKDTSMFKMLTGRDLISGRRKYMTNIHFQNYAKFIFSCNELPMVYDMTKGFWDRWILLEYPYTFVCEDELNKNKDNHFLKLRDEGIIEKITSPEEMSGLLNQALMGLNRLLNQKGFSYTLGTDEVKSKWIRKSNSFMAFCYDFIESESDGNVRKKDLRKKYAEYCKLHKIAPRSDVVIKRVLQDNYGVIEERRDFGGIYEWVWEGIKCK